ncbi:T9SS type B sorting domain-containing protein [Empedobacter falsenii]
MKKIFYFLLLMLSGVVWGQISQFNNLCTNNSDLSLSTAYQNIKFKTASESCQKDDTEVYKNISYYKVSSGGSFEFKYNFTGVNNVNFHVWVLSESEFNNFFLNNQTRYDAVRSSYSNVNTERGLFSDAIDECEFPARFTTPKGKLKPIDVVAGQYIVIGFVSRDSNAKISFVTPGGTAIVCEPEPNKGDLNYSNLCVNESYKLLDIKTDIKNNISSKFGDNTINENSIKIFPENSTTPLSNDITSVVNGTTQINQTYISKIYDNLGKLKYIYTLTFYFRPPIDFNEFLVNGNSELRNIKTCNNIFEWKGKNWYLNEYLNINNPSDYDILYIDYVDKDGNNQRINDPENIYNIEIPVNGTLILQVRFISKNPLKCDNETTIFQSIKNESIVLNPTYSMSYCDGSIFNYEDVLDQMFPSGHTGYSLETALANGAQINFGANSQLTYQVKVKYGNGSCETNEAQLILNKTSPANILPAEIKDICLADFDQSNIDNAISIIQNGNSYNLKFYQEDGLTEITDLLAFIKTTKNGKIIVKALAVDNGNRICDTGVELTFELDESNFDLDNDIPTFNSICSEVGAGNIFKTLEIEDYLKKYFGRTDITFSGISEKPLSDDESEIITFQVKINGEPCWSEEMTLKLQVITKPNVREAISELQADCDDKITIDAQVLSDLFGANSIVDYHYEILHNNSTPLIFVGGKATIKVRFKNKLDNSCFVEKEIIINKKPDLIVDVPLLESYTQANPIVYCEGEDENAKSQIKSILDIINKPTQYPNLVAKSSVDEIFDQFNSNEGFVNVDFEDPNYCGTATIKFYFKRNPLPTITVPEEVDPLCFNELYSLDFTTQTDYNKYTYIVEKVGGTRINGVDKFELDAGIYNITIEDKITGCSIVKTLDVKNAETPTIEKITINKTSIIVTAKGNGKLEYALFGSDGNIIVDWQTKNELIIPDKIADNNFTVKVRLNGCGVFERKDVIYLVLPNVVTPNQDGKNDVWKPMTKNGKINDVSNSYKLIIFDRYGKQILSKEGTNIIEWDGTHNGKPVADGTYWYLLESNEELQVLYSGYIVVKRKIN